MTTKSPNVWKWDASRIAVDRIVDGDTVDLRIDLGFRAELKERFRLYGINAPEINTPAGKAARDFLSNLLPLGCGVVLVTCKTQEKYGRWLATLWLPTTQPVNETNQLSINEQLVLAGHAVYKDYT